MSDNITVKTKIKIYDRMFTNLKSFQDTRPANEFCEKNKEWSVLACIDDVTYLALSSDNGELIDAKLNDDIEPE